MDERYLTELYHKYGGQNTFGSYQAFYNKVQNDSDYRAKLHTFIGGEKGSGKSYSDFESSVKKKEGTGPSLPYGSSQTQPSSGSEPSQEDSGFDGFKWAKEKAEKGRASLQPESYSEAIKQAEAGKKPTSELGLEGVLDIKGPDITAVSESTKPFINPQFNIVTSKKETLPSTETSLKYLPTKEEKILIRRENENKKKQEIEDRRIENSEYNRANDEFFNTYFSSGIENYDSELAKLEADKQLGVYNGYEENYKNRKSELNAARGNAYNQILDKYINDILKNDNNKDFLEIKERYDGIMNDIRKAGFNSFEELQSKYGDVPIESGDPSDSPIFDVVDKADQRFLRQLRIDAINQLEVPDPNRENKYIEGLGYMNKSIDAVSKFHKQAQPIYADYDNLMKDINTFEADFKSGKYGEKEANDIKNSLQSREKEILTRTNQLKKESGLTDYDIARYELAGKKQFVLGSNYENSFSSLKQIDKVQAEEIADRQRWVTENPVLGTIAYFIPAAYQSFSNATVLETARFAKPISELAGFEGYGWTDALYYGVTEYQKDRDYLYGYTGQDIDGDGQVDDLPGFAKYANILAQALGSVASFAIPGTYAKNLFPGLGAGAKAGRFATNWTGAFLMSEGPAYEEAKRAGLSNEEAARSATLIAALQATAEQIVPDIKYLDPSLTKAGFISLIKAGYTGNELFKKGMSYLYDYSKSVSKSSLKEAGEEIFGQLGTDLGKETTNALYTNSNNYNLSSFSNPDYSTKVYDDAWQMKNYVDAGIGGLLTGGFLDGFRNATRVYTQNEMEALSYMGQNWKDILYNIERTESNGVNRGDDRFKQIEGELKGIGDLYSALKGTPGFSELTKANQDMVMSLAYRKRTLEDNAKKLGVTLPSVEESIKGIESRMNDYLTGKLDYGADKPVVYMDDKLAEIGVATVNVNPDGTYDIVPKDLPGLSKEEIIKNADSYIKNSLKDEGFQKIFLHPKTENYAIQESETGQVPVQPEAAVGQQMEEGTPETKSKISTEEGKEEVISTEQKNRRTDLFPDTSEFAQVIGGSTSSSNLSNYTETNGIGMAEYTNPETGVVDVIMSGTSDNDYVGYVRIYENGKPTNRWTSKMSNQSGNKDAFKTMISQVQSKLPENHEYTETTNISLDGLRVYGQQLNRGYEVVTDNNGKPVMNSVSLNQATLEGVRNAKSQEEQDNLYTEMNVETREDFNKIKERVLALMPTARVLWNQANNTVNIQLPVLRKKPSVSEKTITEEGRKEKVGSDVLNRTLEVVDNVEAKIEKIEPINDEERKQAEDSLYELLNDIDSNPNLSAEQKAQMSLPIENRLQKIQDYELGTRTETRTTTQAVATGTTPKTQAKNERATIPLRTAAEESIDVTYNGRAGKLKIEDGNYVFVPNKVGRQQPKSVVIGEAAVTNRDSKFAGVESVNKKGVTTSAQITLPNGSVLGIMDTDLSIDIGIEIAKQEVGPAPQALFDVVFDEIVTENNVDIPYTKAAPKVEAAKEEEVKEQPKTQQAAESDLGQQLLEGNEYNNKRKNELLKKNKSDSKKRNLISSAAVAIEAIKKIYPDLKVYLHENTEEYELATEAQGIKLSEAGAMIFDGNGKVIGVHVDLSKADGTTTPHELTHAILAKAFGDNPVLFKEFKDRVSKLLSESTNKKLNDFANQYEGDVKSEEYLVQLAALLTDNRGKIEPSILQKLMTLINNFVSRITKGNVVPFKSNAKTQALVDFFNSVALTMSTGRDVSGLQSKIRGLQDRFGQAPSESRIIQRETATPEPEVVSKQQIVGERGIENANDKVAQKDLETAKLMASNNRPSTDIKRATGWEMGADGKWRYEYPNVTLKDDLQDENDFRLVVKGYNQSQGISDRFETKLPAIPLSEILNFGELQKAYPYIEDLYFELDDSLQSEAYGQLDIARGLVSLNPKIINQVGIDEVQKVLIHEIQHYIQDQEGFEKGGNVEMFEYEIKNSKDAYKIPGLKLINDYNVEDSIEFGIYDIRNLVDNGVDLMSIYDGRYNKRDYTGNPQALLKAAFRRDQIQKLNPSDVDSAISKIESYVVYSAAHKDYWNMVGETEARNAAKRSETPYLERLYGQTLESTEDVLRRDQIRKDGGKIFKEMDVISNKRGLARQRMEQQNRENFGELYMKAKEINDNFETIINQLGITKICGL